MAFTDLLDVLITGILRGGIYALMALGLALVFGVMNICNFAHGEFYMIGAYVAFFAIKAFGLDPIPAIVAAGLAGFVMGVLIEKGVFYALRRRSKEDWVMNTFLVTVGLSFIIQNMAFILWGATYRGTDAYWKGTVQITPGMGVSVDRIVSFLIAIVTMAAFWLFLRRTQIGRAIRAVSQEERGATLVGINLNNIHTLTFALSCMLAGVAGGSLLSITQAYPAMGAKPLLASWLVVIMVGLGNVSGSIIGGLIVGILEAASYYFLGAGWQNVVSLIVLILILLFKPSGLLGTEVKGVLER